MQFHAITFLLNEDKTVESIAIPKAITRSVKFQRHRCNHLLF